MSFYHSAVISNYNPSYAVPQESEDINAYDMSSWRSYTEGGIMNFNLDLLEHRLLLASSVMDVSGQPVGIEQSLTPTVSSPPPTYIGDKGQHQRSIKELQAQQQQAALRCPSPPINSLGHAHNLQIIDRPVFDANHYEHQSAVHRPALSPPSFPTTAPRNILFRSQSIDPVSWPISEPAPTSSPSQYHLMRTTRNHHRQAEPYFALQYGEPEENYKVSHRAPIARLYPSSENALIELSEHRDEEYGRSQPGRGMPDLSQATTPPSQTRAPKEFVLEEPRPQPPGKNFKWRVFKSQQSAKPRPPSTPSLSITSTTRSTSQGSGSTSEAQSWPPTLPKPHTLSHPANSLPSASAPSSSSSSHQSTKRKRENDERSPSSSTPAKKSKRACKGKSQGPPRKQGRGPM